MADLTAIYINPPEETDITIKRVLLKFLYLLNIEPQIQFSILLC